jgi:hypothetical protein
MFYAQSLDHLLNSIHKLPNLDTLILNKVGLADENIMSFLMMISKTVGLKKLNISGNKDLSPNSIGQILSQIRNRFSNMSGSGGIQELELGKLNFNNNEKTMKELAELLL